MPDEREGQEPQEQQEGQEPQQPHGQEPSGDTQLTQGQLGQLPEWARNAITRANSEAAKYRTERNQYRQLVDAFETEHEGQTISGEDRLRWLHQATSTPEGIKGIFNEIVQHPNAADILGIPSSRLSAILGQAETEALEEAEHVETEESRTLTEDELTSLVEQRVQSALQSYQQTTTRQTLQGQVMAHLKAKGYTDPKETSLILQLGAQHQNDVEIDPSNPATAYIEAVDLGIQDFEGWKTSLAEKSGYLQEKADQAGKTPRTLTGTTPPTGEKWDPSELSWDELHKAAAQRGYYD